MDPFSKINSTSKDSSITDWGTTFEPMMTSAVIPQLIPRNSNDLQNVFYKGQTSTSTTTYTFDDYGWDVAPFTSVNYNIKDIPSYDSAVIFGNSDFNKNESTWPVEDSTMVQNDPEEDFLPQISKEASTSETLAPELSSISNLGLGAVSTIANSALNFNQNSKLELESKEGNGPFGHSFASENQTQNLVNFNTNVTNLENAAIGVGSLFGVEGLAAGALTAGAISLASNAFAPSSAIVPTNSGNLVDPTNF